MIGNYTPKVAAAIIAVMGAVKKIGKNDKNDFANYSFAGIDKFLETMNPLCVDAGIFIACHETDREVITTTKTDQRGNSKSTNWLLMKYDFQIVHESGEVSAIYPRSVMVPAEGAQAFGSAQSYSLKQFMRGLFLIPTGEKDDADFREATTLPENKPPSAYKARKDGDWPKIEGAMRNCSTPDELKQWGLVNKDRISALPPKWQGLARDEYERCMSDLNMRHSQAPIGANGKAA
jgi:hypothetical protein